MSEALPAARPNLMLVIVDAYRQDCLGTFAPDYRFTPRLSSRFGSWHHFDKAFSSAPWTLPSCTSILTGVHATRHLRFAHHTPPLLAPTIAELLGDAYERVAFVNNTNFEESSGLQRGFDRFSLLGPHTAPFVDAADYLQTRTDRRPFFLLFHTNIAHDFYKKMARPYYEECFDDEWFELGAKVTTWQGLSAEQCAAGRRAYDASVLRMDREVDGLLEHVDFGSTAVVFVADHGEGLDVDGGRVHHGGRLHDDLVRVPLVIRAPSSRDGRVAEALAAASQRAVATVDIVPTLLDLAGVENPVAPDGVSLLRSGDDVAPRAIPALEMRYLYAPNRRRINTNLDGNNTTRAQRLRNRLIHSFVLEEHSVEAHVEHPIKLVLTKLRLASRLPGAASSPIARRFGPRRAFWTRSGRDLLGLELFDLDADPGERRNVLQGRSDPKATISALLPHFSFGDHPAEAAWPEPSGCPDIE